MKSMKQILEFFRNERGAVRGGLLTALLLAVLAVAVPTVLLPSVEADGGDFQLDFIAAQEDTYDHKTTAETWPGALQYDDRIIGTNVVEQLEAVDFSCGDTIIYFTRVTVDAAAAAGQTIFLTLQFDAVNNGQHGVGYSDVRAVGISSVDFANQTTETGNLGLDGAETVTAVPGSERFLPVGSTFGVDAEELEVIVKVTGMDAGEQIIVRTDIQFDCFDARVTGNMHGTLIDAFFDADGDISTTDDQESLPRGSGNQDIPMLGLGKLVIDTPTPTPSPTPTDTPTPTPTDTPTPTPTDTPTSDATPTSVAPTATSTPFTEVLGFPVTGNGGPTSGTFLLFLIALAGLGIALIAFGYWHLRFQRAHGR